MPALIDQVVSDGRNPQCADSRKRRERIAGGKENGPAQDEEPMYLRSLSDPDGHVIEAMWMDVAAFERSLGDEIDTAVDA